MSQSRTRNYWSNTLQYSILVLLEQNFLVPNRIGIVFLFYRIALEYILAVQEHSKVCIPD